MQILQHSFSDPASRVSDLTIIAVLFLILRATLQGDPILAVVHEDGLKSVIRLRGSLDDLCLGARFPLLL